MSFLLKKIIDTWNATKEASGMGVRQAPVCPPTPDFSHLTSAEINVIHDVIMRQEEFERQEEGRVRKLREELDSLQRQLRRKSGVSTQDTKLVDLHLCRICFKTKFDDGAGKVCDDCQQRVCQQCGAFSRPRGSVRRTKTESRWRCKLCMARRDVLCRTGGWYHGAPADSTHELKKKLSVSSSPEGETEKMDITGRNPKMVDADQSQLGNNPTDPGIPRKIATGQNTRPSTTIDPLSRRPLLPDVQSLDKENDDQMEDDKNISLKKLILERQLSRRRRQEKLQRQRLKTGLKKPPAFDETRTDSADYSDTNSSTFSSFSDSSMSTFSSSASTTVRVTQQNVLANRGINVSTRYSKLDQDGRGQIVSSDRQRKTSRESSRTQLLTDQGVVGQIVSTDRQRKTSRESPRPHLLTDQGVVGQIVSADRQRKTSRESPRPSLLTDQSVVGQIVSTDRQRKTSRESSRTQLLTDQSVVGQIVSTDRQRKTSRASPRPSLLTDQSVVGQIVSTDRQRKTSRESARPHLLTDQSVVGQIVSSDRQRKTSRESPRPSLLPDQGVVGQIVSTDRQRTTSRESPRPSLLPDQGVVGQIVSTDRQRKTSRESPRPSLLSDQSVVGQIVSIDRQRKTSRETPRPSLLTDQGVVGQIVSTDRQRKTSRESPRTQLLTDQSVKALPDKSPDRQSSRDACERSLEKWRQSGFPNVYLIRLQCRPEGCPFGIKVTGGVQDDPADTRAVVSWVSPEVKATVSEGQEVLEWNGQVLRGQTYDYVSSITSQECSRALLLVNPRNGREESNPVCVGESLSSQDDPPKQPSELPAGKSRILPPTPTDPQQDDCHVKGELQVKLCCQPERAVLSISVLRARNIVSSDMSEPGDCRTFVVISLVPGSSGRDSLETEPHASPDSPEWNQSFVLNGVSLTEMIVRAVQLTVWSRDERCDHFKGEVLIDLSETQLDNQAHWYSLEEHDENSSPLPYHRKDSLAINSANFASHSYKDSPSMCPKLSPEVPIKRNSSPSTGSSNVSPVPFGTSQIVSTEFHLNTVSHPDSFTDKVKKKMRKTVSKMSPLSFLERKDTAGSDDSMSSEALRRLSSKSDKSGPVSRSPKLQKSTYSFNQNLDLLAPPQPPSRTSSCSSLFMSDDEDAPGPYSLPAIISDRPPPDGDDITSTLGPGQIPPKPSAETTVCGDIRLGFMVTKGQLEMDIICAASLHWDRQIQPPDTFVKTYLVEGKKVIQSKKTNIVKTSADPGYHKKIKYSASNIHGRIMKIVVWKRASSADKKICLGEALVRLDALDLSKSTVAWYKLFKMNSTEYGSDEFLSSW